MKIAIISVSGKTKNTQKVVEAMAEEREIDILRISEARKADLSEYDVIGFASGVYGGSFHRGMKKFVEDAHFKQGQKVFTVYTSGIKLMDYAGSMRKTLTEKGCNYIGGFNCRGFTDYGPFKIIGGISKGRPNDCDLEKARNFISGLD